jgi:hypothetical protein
MHTKTFVMAALLATSVMPALAQAPASPAVEMGARPGNEIGTGNSLPRSDKASNTTAHDTRTQIAPNLPSPGIAENATPRDYLVAARKALVAGHTGQAQQSLEMADTRLLDRSVAQGQTNSHSDDPLVIRIDEARRALGNGDTKLATQIVDAALAQ